MSEAKLTLIGFQNYKELSGEDLFSKLQLPEGVEKETLVNNILLQGGEFEVIYSNPDFLENAIGVWSKKWFRTIDKWVKALSLEYNPLDNYDRTEEWEDLNTGTVTEQGTNSNTGTVQNVNNETTGFTGHDESSNTAGSTTTASKSAYDSSVMQDTDKNVLTNSGSGETDTSNTTTVTGSNTRTDNLTTTISNTRTDNLSGKHKGHIKGNIGVTTSMQLIESELSLAEWNLYEKITGLFLSEFVIPLY